MSARPLSTHGVMFKIIGGRRCYELKFIAMSNAHAITVAQDLYDKLGLIGRHYVELNTGFSFTL
jgi:hypothetical protein